ncbi:MAG: ATP-binding protein [Rhodobacteraceae bacterium]|nr:ATP-binding protein [Paracoccaceae bacterium]
MQPVISARKYFGLDPRQVSPELEARFYGSLKMRNASFKTTRQNRFLALDAEIARLLAGSLPKHTEMLDVGVSAGVSTVEILAAMQQAGLAPAITATDLYLYGYILDLTEKMTVLTDRRGWPLQYEYRSRIIRPWVRRLDYLTLTAPLRFAAARILAQRAGRRIAQGEGHRVTLASRPALEAEGISLIEDDILISRAAFRGKFHFIRAANILNLGYFREDQLRTAIGNLHSYLKGPGALLLVVRTAERTSRNDATLFELSDSGALFARQTFGRGSEIAGIVTSARPPAHAANGGAPGGPRFQGF